MNNHGGRRPGAGRPKGTPARKYELRISMKITDKLYGDLREEAQIQHKSVSDLIRTVCSKYIQQEKKKHPYRLKNFIENKKHKVQELIAALQEQDYTDFRVLDIRFTNKTSQENSGESKFKINPQSNTPGQEKEINTLYISVKVNHKPHYERAYDIERQLEKLLGIKVFVIPEEEITSQDRQYLKEGIPFSQFWHF